MSRIRLIWNNVLKFTMNLISKCIVGAMVSILLFRIRKIPRIRPCILLYQEFKITIRHRAEWPCKWVKTIRYNWSIRVSLAVYQARMPQLTLTQITKYQRETPKKNTQRAICKMIRTHWTWVKELRIMDSELMRLTAS